MNKGNEGKTKILIAEIEGVAAHAKIVSDDGYLKSFFGLVEVFGEGSLEVPFSTRISEDGGGGEEEEEEGEGEGGVNEEEEIDREGGYWKFINSVNPVILAAVLSTSGLILALYLCYLKYCSHRGEPRLLDDVAVCEVELGGRKV